MRLTSRKMKAERRTILWVYGGMLVVGALLLKWPGALAAGRTLTWTDTAFTATSAATLCGLTVQNTAGHFSVTGQIVIGVLIQIGGLAAMLLACRALMGPGRDKQVIVMVTVIELAGAAILAIASGRWGVSGFHAVSAFCNAGFDLHGDSLESVRYAMTTHAVVVPLMVLGGLGVPVLLAWRTRHARAVLGATAALYLAGVIVMLAGSLMPNVADALQLNVTANRPRPQALDAATIGGAVADASFLAVTARTGGFQTVPVDQVSPVGRVMVMGLMLIGGSPGSTAGGIHTTTLIVLLCLALGRGESRSEQVRRAAAMAAMVLGVAFAATLLLSLVEPYPIDQLAFEGISATTLTGLSSGIAGELTTFGKWILIAAMVVGRVGPLWLLTGWAKQEPDGLLIG